MQDWLLWFKRSLASPNDFGRGILLGLVVAPASLLAVTFDATLDRDTVAVGDSATLSLVFQGGSPKAQPALPNIPNLRVGYGGQSSSFSWVNGESTSSVTYTFSLTPVQPGDFTIPSMEVKVGGETLHSPPMRLKAARTAAATPDAAGADQQLALLKLALPRKQIYLGEVVQVELDLYLRDTVLNVQQFQFSPLNAAGFTFSKTVQGQNHPVRVGNANFTLVPFYLTMTAVKTGAAKVEPVDCSLVLQLPSAGGRQRDPFDPFGMFQRNESRRVTLSSEAQSIEVLPLPENPPAGFSGAVGNYSFTMSAAPTAVAAGDPVTVKMQIAGRGGLDAVTLPDASAWGDFKTYPPTAKVQTTDQLGLQGAKNFELIVVPQNTDVRELPAVAFSFFDPDAKTYRTITQPAIPLKVRAGAPPAQLVMAGSNANTTNVPPAQELVPIQLHLGDLVAARVPLVQRPGFWMWQSVPVLAWAGSLVRRKRAEALANNPRLRRQRAVAAIIASGLEDLRQLAAKKDSDNFFATLFRLLQEQLGERLDLPATAITESVIDDQLRPRGASGLAMDRLHELFQACNVARYAPVRSSHELEAHIPQLETALREIKGLNP